MASQRRKLGHKETRTCFLGTSKSSAVCYPGARYLNFPSRLLGLPTSQGYENSVDCHILGW